MRIGVLWENNSNAYYRAAFPMEAMERRGHEVVWPPDTHGILPLESLVDCDVVHVYRRWDPKTRELLAELAKRGVGISWDNDDDLSAVPKESPTYRSTGGLTAERIYRETVKTARVAHGMTTPSAQLAERYRGAGVRRVEVIDNHLAPRQLCKPRRHDGVVIGWVAGLEHAVDAARIGVADALREIVARHPDVRVECIGVDLRLPERYRHDESAVFEHLPGRMRGWDIGIAPLADVQFNRSRSSIKLKEYAACGVPWLASPVGPYAGFGEEQGGRLVPDDGWLEALEALVDRGRDRRRLARKARTWAKGETVDRAATAWEAHLASCECS